MQSGAPQTANTILAKGAPDQCAFAPGIAFTALGSNLEEASGQVTGTCGLTTAKHDVFGNPNLGTLASDGGSTPTMALLPGSPAIGSTSGCG